MADWRAALLRRLARRFHIGDDVLRHLSTFQRLGERLEIEAPSEMLPIGARTAVRALRTRSAVQIRPDWVWPYWLERQLDPRSPSFVPRGHLPFAANVTHRNWTLVGNLGSAWEAIVDPAGLVTTGHDQWSLDWWVGRDGAWTLPSRADDLHQELVGDRPIVATTLPLPDGAAVQRTFATDGVHGEQVVVEVENRTGDPLDVAFSVRPYNPEGLAVVEHLEVTDGRITADGEVAVHLPAPPVRVATGTFREGDTLARLEAGDGVGPPTPVTVEDDAGFAQATVTYVVPPDGSVRVALPLPPASGAPSVRVSDLPSVEEEGARWDRILGRGMQVRVPDPDLQSALDANRAFLLLLHDPGSITAGPSTYHRFWFRDAAFQLPALDRWGFHDEVRDVLATYPGRQRSDGFFYSQWREWDANGSAIHVIAEHHRLTGDDDLLRGLAPAIRSGVNWIERTRRTGSHRLGDRSVDRPQELQGLLPAGVSAEHLGPFDYYFWDDFWALRGLVDGAYVARVLGERDAADRIDAAAEDFRRDIRASIRWAADRIGEDVIPAGPYRGIDAGMIGSLVAAAPLGVLPPDDPYLLGTLDVLRDRFTLGDAFFQAISHTGLGTYLTLQLAAVELEHGDDRAWRRLRWMLHAATGTWTWPEAIHPRLGGGCMGDGHHGWAAADLLNLVRQVLHREAGDGSVLLVGVLPPEWHGEEVEVRDAPTHAGRLGWALRWDGDQPILSWEWHGPGARLRAPGLDPAWSTSERSGEARLSPVT